MIKVEADSKDGELKSTLTFNVAAPSQFEDEAESILWCVLMFMADHSELSEREILLSLMSDLDDNDGEPPYGRAESHEEVMEE